MKQIVRVCLLLIVIAGLVGFTERAYAINLSGYIENSSGVYQSGITVYQAEDNSKHSNPTAANGSFTLTGLPSGTDFSLKFVDTNSSPTFANGYSRTYNRTTNASGTAFTYGIFTPSEIAGWYTSAGVSQNPSGGTIRGRVVEALDTTNYISGATVSYTSALGNTYPVYYYNGSSYVNGPSTFSNGRYVIFNVADGDTVNVTASRAHWTFNTTTFATHSGTLNVSVANVSGSAYLYLPLILNN